MPIQIIITGNDAQEAMSHMASFIGMRGLSNQHDPDLRQTNIGRINETGSEFHLQQNGAAGEVTAAEAPKARRHRKPKEETQAAEPEEQQTEIETAAQDDADEVQHTDGAASLDDVRAALNDAYVKKYGMDATQADIAKLYSMRFPDGSVTKATEIPAEMRAQVIEDIREMAAKNPFKRKALP